MKSRLVALIVCAMMAVLGTPARADSFDFASPVVAGNINANGEIAGGIGLTHMFCLTNCIKASGFLKAGGTTFLSQKYLTGDMGLGILNLYANNNGGHNEIQSNDVVQLDLQGLSALTMGISSLTGDAYVVWGSNTVQCLDLNASCAGTVKINGIATTPQPFPLTGLSGDRYLYISATQGDVLVNTLTTTVPEPGSMLLLGTGLLGVAGTLRRKLLR